MRSFRALFRTVRKEQGTETEQARAEADALRLALRAVAGTGTESIPAVLYAASSIRQQAGDVVSVDISGQHVIAVIGDEGGTPAEWWAALHAFATQTTPGHSPGVVRLRRVALPTGLRGFAIRDAREVVLSVSPVAAWDERATVRQLSRAARREGWLTSRMAAVTVPAAVAFGMARRLWRLHALGTVIGGATLASATAAVVVVGVMPGGAPSPQMAGPVPQPGRTSAPAGHHHRQRRTRHRGPSPARFVLPTTEPPPAATAGTAGNGSPAPSPSPATSQPGSSPTPTPTPTPSTGASTCIPLPIIGICLNVGYGS